jgi:hypothetical protein
VANLFEMTPYRIEKDLRELAIVNATVRCLLYEEVSVYRFKDIIESLFNNVGPRFVWKQTNKLSKLVYNFAIKLGDCYYEKSMDLLEDYESAKNKVFGFNPKSYVVTVPNWSGRYLVESLYYHNLVIAYVYVPSYIGIYTRRQLENRIVENFGKKVLVENSVE